LVVEAYEETPDWEQRQRAAHAAMLAARDELVSEFGAEATADILQGEARQLELLAYLRRRILIVARKD
jgi:hypothetical protein